MSTNAMDAEKKPANGNGTAKAADGNGAARKPVNVALQGGGSHGAFTWGVLDALLEDGRLAFEAVSGTSAGAINAAILLQGWSQGGGPGARAALRRFWEELGGMAVASPIQRTPLDRLQGNWNLDDSPAALWADLIQRTLSPWQRNPLKFDPLRDLLRGHFDEKAVRACHDIKVFVAATNVRPGKIKVFAISSAARNPVIPNVPTSAEAGLPEFQASAWNGLFAPKGTPKPILDRLVDALDKARDDDATRKRLLVLGCDIPDKGRRGPEPFLAQIARWTPVIQAANVKIERSAESVPPDTAIV